MTEAPIRVSIVEDNDSIRESLSALISGTPGFICVSTHCDAEDALKQLPGKRPDVVLLDINLPAMSGIECVLQLRDLMPSVKIIMHTVYEDQERLFESLRAGADGYLLKRTQPAKLLEALVEAHKGHAPMSGQIAQMLVNYFHHRGAVDRAEKLTPREREILELLSRGYRYKEIADTLTISIATVRTHLGSIYEKLHVTSRTEAVVKYLSK